MGCGSSSAVSSTDDAQSLRNTVTQPHETTPSYAVAGASSNPPAARTAFHEDASSATKPAPSTNASVDSGSASSPPAKKKAILEAAQKLEQLLVVPSAKAESVPTETPLPLKPQPAAEPEKPKQEVELVPEQKSVIEPQSEPALSTAKNPQPTVSATPVVETSISASVVKLDEESASQQMKFQCDVVILRNEDCISLVSQLQSSLESQLYAVQVKDESDGNDDVLWSTRKLLWILTSNVWSFANSVRAVSQAYLAGVDVVIVRQDGSMWDGLNFPSYASIPASVSPVFKNKAIEHVTPFYAAFLDKLVDRLQKPRVHVWKHFRMDMSPATRSSNLLQQLKTSLDTITAPESDSNSITKQVAMAQLFVDEWLRLAKSNEPVDEKVRNGLLQISIAFIHLFDRASQGNGATILMQDDVEIACKDEDAVAASSSDSQPSNDADNNSAIVKIETNRIQQLSSLFQLMDAILSGSPPITHYNLILSIVRQYASVNGDSISSAIDRECLSAFFCSFWRICAAAFLSGNADALQRFEESQLMAQVIAGIGVVSNVNADATLAGLQLVNLALASKQAEGINAFLQKCAPLNLEQATNLLSSACVSAFQRYGSSYPLIATEASSLLKQLDPDSSVLRSASSSSSSHASICSETATTAPPASDKKEYDIFLSHRQVDCQDMIKRLKIELESHGYTVFLDRDDAGFLADLPQIVRRSQCFYFILSKNVLQSVWCCQELIAAMNSPSTQLVLIQLEDTHWPDETTISGRPGLEQTFYFPPESEMLEVIRPYMKQIQSVLQSNPNGNGKISRMVPHSSFFFPYFFDNLLQVTAAPSIRVEAKVNPERQLGDNIQAVIDAAPTVAQQEDANSCFFVACCEQLTKIIHGAGNKSDSIDLALWKQLSSTLSDQLQSIMYGQHLSAFARNRAVIVLANCLNATIQLNPQPLVQEIVQIALNSTKNNSSSGVLIRLIPMMLKDLLDYPVAQSALFTLLHTVFQNGSSAELTTFVLANTKMIKILLGSLKELATEKPPHVLKQLSDRQLGVSEEEIFTTKSALVKLLTLLLSQFDAETQKLLAAEFASLGFSSELTSMEGLTKNLEASTSESLSKILTLISPVPETSLPVLRPDHMQVPDAELLNNNVESESHFVYILHDPKHAVSHALALRLKTQLEDNNPSWKVHLEYEDMRNTYKYGPYQSNRSLLLVSDHVFDSSVNQNWINVKSELSVVLVESSRWEVEEGDSQKVTSKLPPVSMLPLELRSKLISHSAAYYPQFLETLRHELFLPDFGPHPQVSQRPRLSHAIPELNCLLPSALSQYVEAPNTRLRFLTQVFALTYQFQALISMHIRALPIEQWQEFIENLFHRLMQLHSMPDYTPGKFNQMEQLVVLMKRFIGQVPYEKYSSSTVNMPHIVQLLRQVDGLYLETFVSASRSNHSKDKANVAASFIIQRLIHYNPPHEHEMYLTDMPVVMDPNGKPEQIRCDYCQSDINPTYRKAYVCYICNTKMSSYNSKRPFLACLDCYRPTWTSEEQAAKSLHPCSASKASAGTSSRRTVKRVIGLKSCSTPGCKWLETKYVPTDVDLTTVREPSSVSKPDSLDTIMWNDLQKFGSQYYSSGYACGDCNFTQCLSCYHYAGGESVYSEYVAIDRARELLIRPDTVRYLATCFLAQPEEKTFKTALVSNATMAFAACLQQVNQEEKARNGGDTAKASLNWVSKSLISLRSQVAVRGRLFAGGMTDVACGALETTSKYLESAAAQMGTVSTDTPAKIFNSFPYFLAYDTATDGDVATSIMLSLESLLGATGGRVWNEEDEGRGESSSVWQSVVAACEFVIVLLNQSAFQNTFLMEVCKATIATDPKKLVLVKLDGVSWNKQLYPPMNIIPAALRAHFSDVVAATKKSMESGNQADSAGSDVLVRYIRDYFADFFRNLCRRIKASSGDSSAISSSMFDVQKGLSANVATLTIALSYSKQFQAKQSIWNTSGLSSQSPTTSASSTLSTSLDNSALAFQVSCIRNFLAIYINPTELEAHHPSKTSLRAWERSLRVLLTLLASTTTQLQQGSKGSTVIGAHLLAITQLLSLLCSSVFVKQQLLYGANLAAPLASVSASSKLLLKSNESVTIGTSAPLFPVMFESLFSALVALEQQRNYSVLFQLLAVVRTGQSILEHTPSALHQTFIPHPADKFSLYRHIVASSNLDRFLVKLVQDMHTKENLAFLHAESGRFNDAFYSMYALLNDLLRQAAFNIEELFRPLVSMALFDLASFDPSKNHDHTWMQQAVEVVGRLIRLNGGVSQFDSSGREARIDADQLTSTLFHLLTHRILLNLSDAISIVWTLHQLTLLENESRTILRSNESGYFEFCVHYFENCKVNAIRPTWFEYYLMQIMSTLCCGVTTNAASSSFATLQRSYCIRVGESLKGTSPFLQRAREDTSLTNSIKEWQLKDVSPDVSKDGPFGGTEVRELIKHRSKEWESLIERTAGAVAPVTPHVFAASPEKHHHHRLLVGFRSTPCSICGVAAPNASVHVCSENGCENYQECNNCFVLCTAPFQLHLHPLVPVSDPVTANLYRQAAPCRICSRTYTGSVFLCKDPSCVCQDNRGVGISYTECENCHLFATGQGFAQMQRNGSVGIWNTQQRNNLLTLPADDLITERHQFYFELTVEKLSAGAKMMIGFATAVAPVASDYAQGGGARTCGIDAFAGGESFNSDGTRATGISYAPAWKEGDVVGCLVDLAAEIFQFSVNGELIGPVALTQGISYHVPHAFHAAVSVETNGEGQFVKGAINFGSKQFRCARMNETLQKQQAGLTFNVHSGPHTPSSTLKIDQGDSFEFTHNTAAAILGVDSAMMKSSLPFLNKGVIVSKAEDSVGSVREQDTPVLNSLLRCKPLPVTANPADLIRLPVQFSSSLLPVSSRIKKSTAEPIEYPPYPLPHGSFAYFEVKILTPPPKMGRDFNFSMGFAALSFPHLSHVGYMSDSVGLMIIGNDDVVVKACGEQKVDSLKEEFTERPLKQDDVFGFGFLAQSGQDDSHQFTLTRNGAKIHTVSAALAKSLKAEKRYFPCLSTLNRAEVVKLDINFGSSKFAYEIPAEYNFKPREDLKVVPCAEPLNDRALVWNPENSRIAEIRKDSEVWLTSSEPMFAQRTVLGPPVNYRQDLLLAHPSCPTGGHSKMIYLEVKIMDIPTHTKFAGLTMKLVWQDAFNINNMEYSHSASYLEWDSQKAMPSVNALKRGTFSAVNLGRVARALQVNDICGIGFNVHTSCVFITLNGAIMFEHIVDKEWYSSSKAFFKLGTTMGTTYALNFGAGFPEVVKSEDDAAASSSAVSTAAEGPWMFAAANRFARRRADIKPDAFGSGIEQQDDVGYVWHSKQTSYVATSQSLMVSGKATAPSQAGSASSEGKAEVNVYPNEVQDSVLWRKHDVMQSYAAANPSAILDVAASSLLSRVSEWKLPTSCKQFIHTVQAKSLALNLVANQSHVHLLDRTLVEAQCHWCKRTGQVNFVCNNDTSYAECGSCFLTHSGLSQPHLHSLVSHRNASVSACHFCNKSLACKEAARCCLECPSYAECAECCSKRDVFLQQLKEQHNVLTKRKKTESAYLASSAGVTAAFYATMKLRRHPFKPVTDASLKSLLIDRPEFSFQHHATHEHKLLAVPAKEMNGRSFHCAQCDKDKSGTMLYCLEATCDGYFCCLDCLNPCMAQIGGPWTFASLYEAHAHPCTVSMVPGINFVCSICQVEGSMTMCECLEKCGFRAHHACVLTLYFAKKIYPEPINCNGASGSQTISPAFGDKKSMASLHPHPLMYRRKIHGGMYQCGKCEKWGVSQGWHCDDCDVSFHPQCCFEA